MYVYSDVSLSWIRIIQGAKSAKKIYKRISKKLGVLGDLAVKKECRLLYGDGRMRCVNGG